MVVTEQAIATQVGAEVLARGGNAIDAAVAIGYALAVVHPCCGNLGGGGFLTVHLAAREGEPAREAFLDFREKAPLAATRDMFLDAEGKPDPKKSLDGYLAVGVPGTVLGLDDALQRWGTLPRAAVIAPAIELAAQGFVLTRGDADILASGAAAFAREPGIAAIFLKGGKPLAPGDRLVQADLARTLRQIADQGPDAFYRGDIAARIVASSEAHGGILTREDFEKYDVALREPIRCSYRGFDVVSAPPPSSGGTTLCLLLNILSGHPIGEYGFNSARTVHLMVEAMRRAYVDRNLLLGDPDFVRNPLERLLSAEYAAAHRSAIDPARATPIEPSRAQATAAPAEATQTTHFSVLDRSGNAVAVTYTINGYFGARRIAGDTGFFLNNEMDDFTAKPGAPNLFGLVQGEPNAIAPGKRPLSSMSPTIVLQQGRPFLTLGSPGGGRIITTVLEGILNVVDHGMNVAEAVNSPRVHHQWLPDVISVEPRAFTADTREKLVAMGHKIVDERPWGALEAIHSPGEGASSGAPSEAKLRAFGDDTTRGDYRAPGRVYGANDNRRPAGLAIGR
jgi:gamma-glutamyltranspeptidase / glutathione hydrolase